MSVRLAVGWLEARIWDGGGSDDLADWLDGDDVAVHDRQQQRKRDVIIDAGGEVA